jgi:hypothetical protein
MKIERYLWSTLLMASLLLVAVPHLLGQESIVLDSDSARLFEGFGQYFYSPGQAEKLSPTGQIGEGQAVFKIVKVTNISGNNPFNPTQPVLNFGGIVISSVDDLIDCIRGGTCKTGTGGGSLICSPNSGVSDKANFIDSVGCYIKGNGTICRVERLPSSGDLQFETIFVMYDEVFAMSSVAGTASVSDFRMIKPPSGNSLVWPGGDTVYKIIPGNYTAVVQHKNTGVKYEIMFRLDNLPGNNVRLTVNSLRKM